MQKVIIPGWKSFKYSEIWKILEIRGGAIYKTKNTGLHVENKIDLPDGYLKVTISDMSDSIELNLITSPLDLENGSLS